MQSGIKCLETLFSWLFICKCFGPAKDYANKDGGISRSYVACESPPFYPSTEIMQLQQNRITRFSYMCHI